MVPRKWPGSAARAWKRSWAKEEKHKATAEALGLRKIGDTTVQPDNAATRGKIAHIGYLVEVTEEA